jgi:tetratricopeptide (TPR) repeat protein
MTGPTTGPTSAAAITHAPFAGRLSLTVILGNEEALVVRFLDSFGPLMDELCVVMATGAGVPDRTEEMVKAWADEHSVPLRLARHENRDPWPHVDSFGAARQQSLRLATGDWVMWADADDLFEGTRESVNDLIGRADANGVDLLSLLYEVRNMDRVFPRERLWRRGAARWRHAVHEQVTPTADTVRAWACVGPDHPRIVHVPVGSKTPSRERNLRILESVIAEGVPALFYRAWDLQLGGRTAEAVAEYRRAVSVDNDPQRRFAAFLALASIDPDPQAAADAAHEAMRLQPARREGYGHAATLLLRQGKAHDALGLLTAAAALPSPQVYDWTVQPEWYGPRLDELVSACWRILGATQRAHLADRRRFLEAGERVSLIIPCTSADAISYREIWLATAANRAAVEVVLVVPEGNKEAARVASPYHHCSTADRTESGWVRAGLALAHGALVGVVHGQVADRGWDKDLQAGDTRSGVTFWGREQLMVGTDTMSALARALTTFPGVPDGPAERDTTSEPCVEADLGRIAGSPPALPPNGLPCGHPLPAIADTLVLLQRWDWSQSPRAHEFDKALVANQKAAEMDRCALAYYTEGETRRNLGEVLRTTLPESRDRPLVLVFANADIDLTHLLAHLHLSLQLPARPKTAWALARDGMTHRADSQDAWVLWLAPWRGAVDLPALAFPMGLPGSDNRLAWELWAAGWHVTNPSLSILLPHYHASEARTYSSQVPGPYALVPPGKVGECEEARPAELQPDGKWRWLTKV